MSDWNPLELRKWNPRQPSPELRAKIFAAESAESTAGGAVAFSLGDVTRWIVPAFGCFLLAVGGLSSHVHTRYGAQLAAETATVFPLLSEASGGQLPPESTKHSVMNSIPARRLEWIYGPRTAATSASTLLISYTNKLMR